MFDRLRTRLLGWSPTGKALGAAGERVAAARLRQLGHRVLLRNHLLRRGELDLVTLAPDGRTIVIVEVKTRLAPAARTGVSEVAPEAAITRQKTQKLLNLTREIAVRRGWVGRPIRIDVVGVDWHPRGRHTIRHFENAVTAPGR